MKIKSKLATLMACSLASVSLSAAELGEAEIGSERTLQDVLATDLHELELQAFEDMELAKNEAPNGGSYFVFMTASGATPYQSGYTYNYANAGCFNSSGTSGNTFFDQSLNLPEGHTITFMRFYYNDTDNTNTVAAFLQKYDGAGGIDTVASRISDSDTGYSSVGDTLTHVVDNTTGGLLVRYRGQDSTGVNACGVRFVVDPN